MAAKCVLFLALAVFAAQAQTVNEITFPDQTTTHLSNPLIPKTISLPHFFFDKVVFCNLVFPNGQIFDLTTNDLQNEYIEYEGTNCGAGFRNAPPSMSGTYELIGRVDHLLDETSSLMRRKFHLTFYYSDDWQIPSKK